MSQQRRALIDTGILFLLTCVLIGPLFKREFLDNWGSIESTFIADSRMLRDHLPHPAWQPLWYCGTRFDYIYPPALRYGTALLSLLAGISTARAYHVYTAFFYAAGIAGVYWLAYVGSRSRFQAWLAGLATALFSPCFLLMANLRHDSPHWAPQRLHVLTTYGEGPHITALAILGWALAVVLVALRDWKPRALCAAAVLCAGVVATNFYGATALALFFLILAWSVWLELRRPMVWFRAAGIAAIAYGLCAFWLTPSYFRITAMNMKWVAEPSSPFAIAIAAASLLVFAGITFGLAKRHPLSAWPVFLAGSAVFTSLYVLGWQYFHLSITGNATRLAPELDLALTLLLAWSLTLAWKQRRFRAAVVVLLCAACYPAFTYILNRHAPFPRATASTVTNRPEFQITKWMHENLPEARALPTGSIRYWYNAWYDDSEAYGGSNQGMLNQILPMANFQITQGERADLAIAWLQALGVDAVIVSDKTSQEIYHDYSHPEKFRGLLPAIYDDHLGNVIYRVPRRYTATARVVDRASLIAAGTPRAGDDQERIMRYVAVVENGPGTEVSLHRPGWDGMDVRATLSPGQAVLVQETFDPAWRAQANGVTLPIEPDPLGFMLIAAPAGFDDIHLRMGNILEDRVGWALTAATLLVLAYLMFAPRLHKHLS